VMIPVEVDYSSAFPAADIEAWEAEYQANIKADASAVTFGGHDLFDPIEECYDMSYPQEWIEYLELMEPEERRAALEELANRPDLYSREAEVIYE